MVAERREGGIQVAGLLFRALTTVRDVLMAMDCDVEILQTGHNLRVKVQVDGGNGDRRNDFQAPKKGAHGGQPPTNQFGAQPIPEWQGAGSPKSFTETSSRSAGSPSQDAPRPPHRPAPKGNRQEL